MSQERDMKVKSQDTVRTPFSAKCKLVVIWPRLPTLQPRSALTSLGSSAGRFRGLKSRDYQKHSVLISPRHRETFHTRKIVRLDT
jgi:hypothetical protein